MHPRLLVYYLAANGAWRSCSDTDVVIGRSWPPCATNSSIAIYGYIGVALIGFRALAGEFRRRNKYNMGFIEEHLINKMSGFVLDPSTHKFKAAG